MTKVQANLVGMHFRPPANEIVPLLDVGTPLLVQREPDNLHDVDAVKVLLPGFSPEGSMSKFYDIAYDIAKDGGADYEVEQLVDPLHLGYVCNSEKTGGKCASELAKMLDPKAISQVSGELGFNARGRPVVIIDLDEINSELLEAQDRHSQNGEQS